MSTRKIIYWVSTIIVCAIMCMSAFMYFTQYEMVKGFYETFGYPTYIIYPLAVAKVLGVVAILTKISRSLTEWAYAGFFYDILLAFMAHYTTDGSIELTIVAMFALQISYYSWKKLYV